MHRRDEGRAEGQDAEAHRAARRVQRRQEGARQGQPPAQVREEQGAFGDRFGGGSTDHQRELPGGIGITLS